MVTVDEIMTTDLQTLPQTASVADAVQLMAQHRIRHIPIVDAKGALVGLVSHRDLLAATDSTLRAAGERQSLSALVLEDIMTRAPATVDERASLRQTALFLQDHKYGCLPVVTNGTLKGIVTDSDFVAVAIHLLEQIEETEPPEIEPEVE